MPQIELPKYPLVKNTSKACIIRSAQGKEYVYSSNDNNIYKFNDPKTALSEIDRVFDDSILDLGIDKKTIINKIKTGIEHLVLNVTEQCNLRCSYCAYSGRFIDERQHSNIRMSKEIAFRALEYYFTHSSDIPRKIISFYGGEPLLEFKLIRNIVERVYENFNEGEILFCTITNGTVRHKNDTDFFSDIGMILSISLDGPPEIHDSRRLTLKGEPSWKSAMSLIEDISDKYKDEFLNKIGLSITIVDYNEINRIHNFFKYHPLLSKMTMSVNFVDWSRSANSSSDSLVPYQLLHSFAKQYCFDIISSDGIGTDMFLASLFDIGIGKLWERTNRNSNQSWPAGCCIPGSKRLFVSSAGKLMPCERVGLDFSIGHIENGISTSACIKILRDFIKEVGSECKNCWARRLCNICPSTARWKNKIDKQRILQFCERVRSEVALLLSMYLSLNELDNKIWLKRFRHLNIPDKPINLLFKNQGGD